jgi:capsular polysaccharide transport system permease protein
MTASSAANVEPPKPDPAPPKVEAQKAEAPKPAPAPQKVEAPQPSPAPPKAEAPSAAVQPTVSLGASAQKRRRDDLEESESKFVLIRMVTVPFEFLRKKKSPSLENSLTVRETAIAPHVTHLELQERAGGSGVPPRRRLPWSFLMIVVLPTLLAFTYFGFIASDQYESDADYVIKTQSGGDATPAGLSGIMGMMGGGHGDSMAMGDSAMVEAYVGSDQILRDLSREIDLRAIYSSREIDWFSRLKSTPEFFKKIAGRKTRRTTAFEISDEDLLKYWKTKVQVLPGDAPGTSKLSVLAFTPEDSKNIADHVIRLGERLVNKVSERAMKDAVVYAQKEVDSAHDRAMKAFDDLQEFQARAKQVDPAGYVQARSAIQGKMESDLSSLQTQMESLRKILPEEAPGIQQLRWQASALQEQLLLEKNRSTTAANGKSAAEIINEFAKHQLETDFASKDYLSALQALETARINATRQNRYLEAFDLPQLPDKPALPNRWYNIVTVLAFCLLLWGVWTLFVAGVKEHQH